MTTQNQTQIRNTWSNLAADTYYAPGPSIPRNAAGGGGYIDMDGYDHLAIMFSMTCGAGNTATLTVWSDDGVTTTFPWDETTGCYDSCTNSYNASYVQAAGGTLVGHLHLEFTNAKWVRARLVIAGGADNSGILTFRKSKV